MENKNKLDQLDQTATSAAQANAAPAQKERYAYTPAQRWLLLGTLVLGVLWRFGWGETPVTWGMFWLAALIVLAVFLGRRAIENRTAVSIGVAGALLCVLEMVHGCMNETSMVYGFLLPTIPAVMMLYLVFATRDVPVKREGLAVRGVLRGLFVEPFSAVPRFFGAIGTLGSINATGGEKNRGAWKWTLVGLAVAVPLTVAVTLLLMRTDSNMQRLFAGMLHDVPLGEWLGDALVIAVVAMLFYSLFFNAVWRKQEALPASASASWPAGLLLVVTLPLLTVYAVFLCLQFSYLFGNALPKELTYSQYARQGFMELNIVAVINFTLYGLAMRYVKPSRLRTPVCALLLTATGLIVLSGVARLLLYIGAYGLTDLRILSTWFAVFLLALTALAAVRLFRERLPLMRIAGVAFLYWYVLLNVPDWYAVIAAYNLAHGMG